MEHGLHSLQELLDEFFADVSEKEFKEDCDTLLDDVDKDIISRVFLKRGNYNLDESKEMYLVSA